VKEKTLLSAPLSSMMGIPVGQIAALAQALEEGAHLFDHVCLETARLRDKLEKGILQGFPEAKVLLSAADRLPNSSAIVFPGVVSDALLFLLHRKGVYGSFGGGHCQKLSHILVACGIDETLAQCALSFSLCHETKEEEVDYAIKAIVECAQKLKNLSSGLIL
jgi:cysteine desulfurase